MAVVSDAIAPVNRRDFGEVRSSTSCAASPHSASPRERKLARSLGPDRVLGRFIDVGK